MEPPVVAALVAAGASLLVALWTAIWTSIQNAQSRRLQQQLSKAQLQSQRELADKQEASQRQLAELNRRFAQEAEEEEQRSEARVVLNRYREPLLEDAYYLGDRIDNIRNTERDLFAYLKGNKDTIVILSTLFRFARYFAMREIIYAEVNHLQFEKDEETKEVEVLLSDIRWTFATDELDRTDGFATSRFMLWVEEQQAIGELSIHRDSDGTPRSIGFAMFTENFEARHARWFANFASDLRSADAAKSERLARLQGLLLELVRRLDQKARFTGSVRGNWVTRTMSASKPPGPAARPDSRA